MNRSDDLRVLLEEGQALILEDPIDPAGVLVREVDRLADLMALRNELRALDEEIRMGLEDVLLRAGAASLSASGRTVRLVRQVLRGGTPDGMATTEVRAVLRVTRDGKPL